MKVSDIIIIGGGPTGLFAAYYAGQRGMSTSIIDTLPELGGQLIALYPEKTVYDVPGHPKILARDLARLLIEQGLQYDPGVFLDERIIRLERGEAEGRDCFVLVAENGNRHYGRAILLTVGIGAFTPRRLDIPDARDYEGKGVCYSARRLSDFRDARVLIVGGGDSAFDWAWTLIPVAKSITLIHRSDIFRAQEESVRRLQGTPVAIRVFHELQSIRGNGKVEAVTVLDTKHRTREDMPVDRILLSLGFLAKTEELASWGLAIGKNDVVVNSKMETNIPGIYAAGDISTYPGKLKLIATGFGEAAVAVNGIKAYLDPRARYFPGHSTDRPR